MYKRLRFATSYSVGDDFKALLQDITIAYLIEKPENLIDFGLNYFGNKKSPIVKGSKFAKKEYDFEPEPIKRPERRMTIYSEPYRPEEDKYIDQSTEIFPKADFQKQSLIEQARKVVLFKSLDDEQFDILIDAMFEKKVNAGEVIIQQGDDGDYFYIIDSGIYEVSIKDKLGNVNMIKLYRNSGSFGELALLYNTPRSATIIAKTDGCLWLLKRETFKRIVVTNAFKKLKLYELLLNQVPMLSALEPYEKLNIADALVTKTYKDGQKIIQQGDTADGMYFVESGEVQLSVLNDSEEETIIKQLKEGDYFGELALVTHQPRAASAYAIGPVKLAFLNVEAFERLLGPCMEIMRRNMVVYEEQLKYIKGASRHDRGFKV